MSRKQGSSYRWTANLERETYIVKTGKFKGAYHVYKNEAAFRKDHPNLPLKHWHEGEVGDYVWTDCGRIVPVLARTVLRSRKRVQRPTIAIRVPHGTVGYYKRVDGTTASEMVLEKMLRKASGRSSMEAPTTYKTGKSWTKKKQRFAMLLAQGATPYRAFMMAWGERNIDRAKRQSRALLREEGDRFMSEIKKAYDEIFDAQGMGQEDIAVQLVDIAKNSRSPKAALDAIALILELRGERTAGNVTVNLPPPPLPNTGSATPISAPVNIPPKELKPITISESAGTMNVDATPASSSSHDSSS